MYFAVNVVSFSCSLRALLSLRILENVCNRVRKMDKKACMHAPAFIAVVLCHVLVVDVAEGDTACVPRSVHSCMPYEAHNACSSAGMHFFLTGILSPLPHTHPHTHPPPTHRLFSPFKVCIRDRFCTSDSTPGNKTRSREQFSRPTTCTPSALPLV